MWGETYINIKPQDGVLLAVPLESSDFRLKLVVLLLPLGPRSVVSLWLLALRRSLLVSLRLLLRLRRILTCYLRRLWMVAIRRGSVRSVVRILVTHVAILLGTLAIGRRLRRQRGRGDIASGRLSKGLAVVFWRGGPWISAVRKIRVVGRVVHSSSEWNGSKGHLLLAIEDGRWSAGDVDRCLGKLTYPSWARREPSMTGVIFGITCFACPLLSPSPAFAIFLV
jgi:hypothetical protein